MTLLDADTILQANVYDYVYSEKTGSTSILHRNLYHIFLVLKFEKLLELTIQYSFAKVRSFLNIFLKMNRIPKHYLFQSSSEN